MFSGITPAALDSLTLLFRSRYSTAQLWQRSLLLIIIDFRASIPFTGLIGTLYVLQAGPDAPQVGEVLYTPHAHLIALHRLRRRHSYYAHVNSRRLRRIARLHSRRGCRLAGGKFYE